MLWQSVSTNLVPVGSIAPDGAGAHMSTCTLHLSEYTHRKVYRAESFTFDFPKTQSELGCSTVHLHHESRQA